jgi:hypothetical protein
LCDECGIYSVTTSRGSAAYSSYHVACVLSDAL